MDRRKNSKRYEEYWIILRFVEGIILILVKDTVRKKIISVQIQRKDKTVS